MLSMWRPSNICWIAFSSKGVFGTYVQDHSAKRMACYAHKCLGSAGLNGGRKRIRPSGRADARRACPSAVSDEERAPVAPLPTLPVPGRWPGEATASTTRSTGFAVCCATTKPGARCPPWDVKHARPWRRWEDDCRRSGISKAPADCSRRCSRPSPIANRTASKAAHC